MRLLHYPIILLLLLITLVGRGQPPPVPQVETSSIPAAELQNKLLAPGFVLHMITKGEPTLSADKK